MSNEAKDLEKISEQLDNVIVLLKQSIVVSLYTSGVTQDEIAKNLNLSKTTVNQMVKGIKRVDQKPAKASPKKRQ
jgi:DNA-binding transcriptional regulator LsrR (DeoR family)